MQVGMGTFFPIWGTCLGFETLNILTAGFDVTSPSDADDVTLTLNFTQEASKSQVLKDAPKDIILALEKMKIT